MRNLSRSLLLRACEQAVARQIPLNHLSITNPSMFTSTNLVNILQIMLQSISYLATKQPNILLVLSTNLVNVLQIMLQSISYVATKHPNILLVFSRIFQRARYIDYTITCSHQLHECSQHPLNQHLQIHHYHKGPTSSSQPTSSNPSLPQRSHFISTYFGLGL